AALQRVAVEHDTLVTVLREAADDGEPKIVAVVFSVLARFWIMRGAFNEVFAFAPLVFEALETAKPVAHREAARSRDTDATAPAMAIVAFALPAGGNSRDAARARTRLRRIRNTVELTEPLTIAIVDLTLAWGSTEKVRAHVDESVRSFDPNTAATALL